MAKKKPQKLKKSLFSSYLTTTLSISMILFLFGLLGLLIINAQRLSDYVMENIGVTLILRDDAKEADVMKLQKNLEMASYIKSTRFVDKESAAVELKKELGEDFVDFLGFNPLLSSIDVTVFAGYANPDSLAMLEKKLLANPEIQEVYYQRNLVKQLNSNVKKISFILLALCLLMFVIFTALINNTIRLSVYSKRFLIRTFDFQKGEILVFDKPLDWTSFDLVHKVRYIICKHLKIKKLKVGHAGTLDPKATGILVLCTGKATSKIDSLQADEKEYVATLKLGATTPSFDLESTEDRQFETSHISKDTLVEVLKKFIVTIEQVPPEYSAIKIDGKRAYEYARKGIPVEIKPKILEIKEIEVLSFSLPEVKLRIVCGKGTYTVS